MPKAVRAMCWFLAIGACWLAKPKGVASEPADRPTPRFVVKALPKEYRIARKQGGKLVDDTYSLSPKAVVPGRDCFVAAICHSWSICSVEPFGPNRDAEFLGWVAIDTRSGDSTYLTLENPTPSAGFRVAVGSELYPWSDGTCALKVRFIPIHAKREGLGEFHGEEQDLWEWNPATRSLKRLGRSVPVASLANALIGTDYQVEWSDRDAVPWNGNVRLTRRVTGKSNSFLMKNLVFKSLVHPSDRGTVDPVSLQQCGPTEDRNSIIVADHSLNTRGSARFDFAVWRFDLEANRTVWRLDRAALEKAVGGRILHMRLVDGPLRPCHRLPVLILSERNGAQSSRILWTLEANGGRLDGPFPLSWNDFEGTLAFEMLDVVATREGDLLASYYRGRRASRYNDHVAVYDTIRKRVVADLQTGDLRPEGFDSQCRLVLRDGGEIGCLPAPYAGNAQTVFRLDEHEDGRAGAPP